MGLIPAGKPHIPSSAIIETSLSATNGAVEIYRGSLREWTQNEVIPSHDSLLIGAKRVGSKTSLSLA